MKEEQLNYFLSISLIAHLLFLFLLSIFAGKIPKKEIPIIEISLLKIEIGGIPASGKSISARPKMLAGSSYPFTMEGPAPSIISPRREYAEPTHLPFSAVPSPRGDISISGVEVNPTLKTQGIIISLKRGPNFPGTLIGTGEALSPGNGEKFGIIGPAAKRRVLYFECPTYPEWAEKKGIESRVKLKFWVSPDGDVDEVVVEQRGYLQLDNLAVQSFKKWRFEPLSPQAKQVRQWGTIEMIFKLQ